MRPALLVVSLFVIATTCAAQDTIKVVTEEVKIPITAKDSNGRFDPTVELSDLLVKENGIAQQLKSVYRMPASVMLVLDTGEELNRAKNVRLTREVAASLIDKLQNDDQIAVMQVNNKIELLQSWTTTKSEALKSLDQLIPDKRTVLLKGLLASLEHFNKVQPGNSHLVLVSDGVGQTGAQSDLSEAYEALIAANVTLHVISYAALGAKVSALEPTRPRVKSAVAPELIEALPRFQYPGESPDLRTIMQSKGGGLLDIDLLFRRKGIKPQLVERSKEFLLVTEETGGNLWLPSSADQMIREARDVAQDIDSQYVMSYRPVPPWANSKTFEYRSIDVLSRRADLTVKARRGYVVKSTLDH